MPGRKSRSTGPWLLSRLKFTVHSAHWLHISQSQDHQSFRVYISCCHKSKIFTSTPFRHWIILKWAVVCSFILWLVWSTCSAPPSRCSLSRTVLETAVTITKVVVIIPIVINDIDMKMIIEGSPVAVVQPSPTNGSSLLAGGQVLNSNQHFKLTLNYWCYYYPFHSNCMSTITGVPRASSTDVAPNQISGIDYLR